MDPIWTELILVVELASIENFQSKIRTIADNIAATKIPIDPPKTIVSIAIYCTIGASFIKRRKRCIDQPAAQQCFTFYDR